MSYLMFLAMAGISTTVLVLTKRFQMGFSFSKDDIMGYNFINACFGCLYFWIASGFRLELNLPTAIYSIIFGTIVCLNLTLSLYAMTVVSVSIFSLTTMAGQILLPSVFGILYFHEAATIKVILSILMITISVMLPYMQKGAEKLTIKKFVFCACCFVLVGSMTVLSQLYAKSANVCDEKSYFFFTNFVAVLVFGFVLLYRMLESKAKHLDRITMPRFNIRQIANIGTRTGLNNLSSILSIILLRFVNASVYTVVLSSLSLISSAVISMVLFREKMNLQTAFAVVLAIGALFLMI